MQRWQGQGPHSRRAWWSLSSTHRASGGVVTEVLSWHPLCPAPFPLQCPLRLLGSPALPHPTVHHVSTSSLIAHVIQHTLCSEAGLDYGGLMKEFLEEVGGWVDERLCGHSLIGEPSASLGRFRSWWTCDNSQRRSSSPAHTLHDMHAGVRHGLPRRLRPLLHQLRRRAVPPAQRGPAGAGPAAAGVPG